MKKIFISILLIALTTFSYSLIESEFKVIESKNTLDSKNLLLDINTATESEMLRSGISKGYVDKLLEYRAITGGFENLKDMVRVDGIGKKTFEKLKGKFKEVEKVKLNKFNINKVDDKTLIYYGLSKKEIQNIRKYHEDGKIRSNLEIKKIISKKRYEDLKDYIEY
ncbi:helix-hairpin-helix domain-containing protein [uncultured Cetobacterium sp.]|uniref:helix-hairpin-helix domain-containing protein n=1 Tax=uncultured Cetobacterium sp. TaxID=527638 RepID=UPI002628CADE|nr:helix-hairpin-helix domain-containing protein [uncultured Cetobacterium sp.]